MTHLAKCNLFLSYSFMAQILIPHAYLPLRILPCPMYDLPMGSSWPNTIDHGTKASSERLRQEGIENGVDARITVGEQ